MDFEDVWCLKNPLMKVVGLYSEHAHFIEWLENLQGTGEGSIGINCLRDLSHLGDCCHFDGHGFEWLVRCSFTFRLPFPRQLFRLGDLIRVHPFGERIP